MDSGITAGIIGLLTLPSLGSSVFHFLAFSRISHVEFFFVRLLDAGHTHHVFLIVQTDQDHALSIASKAGNLAAAGTYQRAAVADQHYIVTLEHLHRSGQLTVTLGTLHGNHALTTTTAQRELFNAGFLAVATLGRGQYFTSCLRHHQGNDLYIVVHAHTAHTASGTAHGTHIIFVEADRLAGTGDQHHIVLTTGQGGANQAITLNNIQRYQTRTARTREGIQRRLFHGSVGGCHEDETLGIELLNRQDGTDPFTLGQRQNVDHRATTGGTTGRRNLIHLEPVHLAHIGEAENG